MASQYVIEVNEMNFEYEVLSFSKNKPVLVDFWAEWCQPCKVLGPMLEKIVNEANGSLRLAKVNIDQNPNLAIQFNVRSIPTVKAFIDGKTAAEFVGVQPESRLREFINKLAQPSPHELEISKGNSFLMAHEWDRAETVFRNVLIELKESDAARIGLSKALLAMNAPEEALTILEDISNGKEYNQSQLLLPYAEALQAFQDETLPEESDLDFVFNNAVRLASLGKFPVALDGLLDILRQDKDYRERLVHQVVLSILEIMGEEDPQTRTYRSELASVLF